MVYQSGEIITANADPDYNALADDINEVYNDFHPGETAEVPGNYGYGEPILTTPVAPNQNVTATQWNALFNTIATCATHQGISLGDVPSSVSPGEIIDAFDGATGTLAVIANLIANREAVAVGQFTLTSNGNKLTSTRNTAWSSQITHQFDVDFGSFDAARYFFNTGGQIRISGSRTGGSANTTNTNWTTILNDIETVIFTRTLTSGQSGVSTSIGFYDMTSTYQVCFTKQAGGYAGDNYEVAARSSGAFGTSGIIQFRIRYNTSGTADGTLSSFVDEKRSTGVIVKPSPTFTTNTPLTTGG